MSVWPTSGERVAGDEVLAVADADDERAAEPGGDDHVGTVAEHDRQAVGAAELREGRLHGRDERRVLVGGLTLCRCRFAVRVGGLRALLAIRWAMTSVSVADLQVRSRRSSQLLLERAEVFDDAVVDERDDAVAAEVRMGVVVGRRAVRGPAGVADADVAGRG